MDQIIRKRIYGNFLRFFAYPDERIIYVADFERLIFSIFRYISIKLLFEGVDVGDLSELFSFSPSLDAPLIRCQK